MQIEEVNLKAEQVILLICESNTGIIMDAGLNYLPSDQSHRLVFPSLEGAKNFIEAKQRPNATFMVYNHLYEMIYEVTLPPEPFVAKKKRPFWQFWAKNHD